MANRDIKIIDKRTGEVYTWEDMSPAMWVTADYLMRRFAADGVEVYITNADGEWLQVVQPFFFIYIVNFTRLLFYYFNKFYQAIRNEALQRTKA